MLNYKQNELLKLFIENIMNNFIEEDSQKPMENSRDKKLKEIYNKIIKDSKQRPILNELINDYFSNINFNESSIDIELPYIIQILALINNSIGSMS